MMAEGSIDGSAGGNPEMASRNYLTHPRGISSWLWTLDHKRIAILYMVGVLVMFFLGGVMALLIRTELLRPKQFIMSADMYNTLFTLHGAVMIFLFLIPGTPGMIGNFVLPLMLGAKDVAFPRLNLASFYMWLIGSVFTLVSITMGGVETGWTFYTPYSTTTNSAVIPVVFGVFLIGFSSIFTGINFIVSIHKLRAPGMTWFRMPLMLWSLYATSIIQVLATPVLGITLLLLIAERVLKVGIFTPEFGGDPILYQHFFWFYSHPAVYIMILPAMGIISEIIPVFARKRIFGYTFIAYSSIAIAVIGFLVWGHHMFVSGMSGLAAAIFSALTFAVAIPSAVKVFNWTATLYKGSISLATPMCYAMGFLLLFAVGGLTGLHLGSLATDVHLTSTYFVVAHFHYVMFGGAVMALLAGIHYWWPKIFGRMYNDALGQLGCLLIVIGFNATFFPQFVAGSHGLPRRYWQYPEQYQWENVFSTVGAYLLGASFLMIAGYLMYSLVRGRSAPANPWGGATLEWQTASPPPTENFADAPAASDPYGYEGMWYDEKVGGYVDQTPAKEDA